MEPVPAPSAVMERERLTAEMSFRGDAAQQPGLERLPSIIIKIRRRLPDFARSVNLKYVKLGIRHGGSPTSYLPMLCVPVLASAAYSFVRLDVIYHSIDLLTCVAWLGTAMLLLTVYYFKRPRPVYLVEFACYKPDDQHKISKDAFLEMTDSTGAFNDAALEFQTKITTRSALGDETYLPPGVQARPPRLNMAEARLEAEAVMFGCLDALFASTGINPRRDVRILIVNCSLFNPTPSLASMIIHHYRMREDVKSFNLGGMGCSAGLIAIDLAKDMLQAHPNSYAVVLSTENITLNWYFGNDKSMLLSNCIFRMGGAAALLSNRRADAGRAKYRLLHTVRTHKGATDECFNCVYQKAPHDSPYLFPNYILYQRRLLTHAAMAMARCLLSQTPHLPSSARSLTAAHPPAPSQPASLQRYNGHPPTGARFRLPAAPPAGAEPPLHQPDLMAAPPSSAEPTRHRSQGSGCRSPHLRRRATSHWPQAAPTPPCPRQLRSGSRRAPGPTCFPGFAPPHLPLGNGGRRRSFKRAAPARLAGGWGHSQQPLSTWAHQLIIDNVQHHLTRK